MRRFVFAAMMAMAAGAASAGDQGIDIEIMNIVVPEDTPGVSHIMLSITRSRDEPASFVQVDCTAIDHTGAEVAAGDLRMQNLAAREVRVEPLVIVYDGIISGAACTLEKYIP